MTRAPTSPDESEELRRFAELAGKVLHDYLANAGMIVAAEGRSLEVRSAFEPFQNGDHTVFGVELSVPGTNRSIEFSFVQPAWRGFRIKQVGSNDLRWWQVPEWLHDR